MHTLPPVGIAALAVAAGVAAADPGATLRAAPLLLAAALTAPITASRRLTSPWLLMACLAAGALLGSGAPDPAACLLHGANRLPARPLADLSAAGPAVVVRVEDAPCEVRVELGAGAVAAAAPAVFFGSWRTTPAGGRFQADSARVTGAEDPGGGGMEWRLVRWRAGVSRRIAELFPERAPLVDALVLARREGLDPQLRDAFARLGIAHLLAISGFHVGVVAGILLALAGLVRVPRRARRVAAAVGVVAYTALLGFPAAATRAALILLLSTAASLRRRPADRWGPLSLAFLLLLVWRPHQLFQPGFQLSFAGAAGLTLWSAPLRCRLARWCGPAAAPLAAGIAATAATLPIVAWHFQRVSLVGIPATLVAAPLVALAVPGVLMTLAAEAVLPSVAQFLAGGTDWVLGALEGGARSVAGWPFLVAWTEPVALLRLSAGYTVAQLLLLRWAPVAYRAATRRGLAAMAACAILLAWPLAQGALGRGVLRLVFLDVGQGDAIALRTPSGRWMLVDAGPDGGRGAPPAAVRALRRLGVLRLETLVLTHPDLDHVGGAAAVLGAFPVGRVMDPGLPAPSDAYIDALTEAGKRGARWEVPARGDARTVDGVTVRVLAPARGRSPAEGAVRPGDTRSNDASLVLHVHWRGFDALLMGDAPARVEEEVLALLPDTARVEVLKVGHHGSTTSSDSAFLARLHPELAVISVGRRNRYGHPAAAVLRRLERFSRRVARTDREGTVHVQVRPDGRYAVRTERVAGAAPD